MSATIATFKVQDVFHITGRTNTYLTGKIETGEVRAGMSVKMLVDRDAFMSSRITAIELVRDVSGKSNVALVLDTPNEVIRAAWKDLHQPGEILAVDEEEANQSSQPTSLTRRG